MPRSPKPRPVFYDAVEYSGEERPKKAYPVQDATGKTGKRERYDVDKALASRPISNYELRKLGAWIPIPKDSPKKSTSEESSTKE